MYLKSAFIEVISRKKMFPQQADQKFLRKGALRISSKFTREHLSMRTPTSVRLLLQVDKYANK